MKILVVGAGIAGSAVAHMLTHDGHDVLMIDTAEQPSAGGYQIVLDTAALDVLGQMGAAAVVNDLSAPSAQVTVHRRGRALTTLPTPGNRLARRGDLVGAITRHAARRVPDDSAADSSGSSRTRTGSQPVSPMAAPRRSTS